MHVTPGTLGLGSSHGVIYRDAGRGCRSRARALGQAITEALQGVEPPAGAVGTGAAFVRLQAENERLRAELAGMTRQAADVSRACSERVRDLLVGADGAKHLDETGFRIEAQTQWLQVLSTRWLTFYRTGARRGSLLQGLRGCLVHDHWKPYLTVPDMQHALCNAHHLLDLEALKELDGEEWAHPMQQLLRVAGEAAWVASAEGFALEPGLIALFEERYDRSVAEALEYDEGLETLRPLGGKGSKKRCPGHNLALRLRDFKTETLRFLHDAGVPFTNNQAERDLRVMKLCIKISGVFRSERGTKDFATLRSALSTAQNRVSTGSRRSSGGRPCCSTACAASGGPHPRHLIARNGGTRPRCASPIQHSGSADRRGYLSSYTILGDHFSVNLSISRANLGRSLITTPHTIWSCTSAYPCIRILRKAMIR